MALYLKPLSVIEVNPQFLNDSFKQVRFWTFNFKNDEMFLNYKKYIYMSR